MPDVSRSDSQRSDSSVRPRVSFNRDVHVKRIGTAGAPRVVGALAGDGSGRLQPLAVRRERPTRLSRRDLAKEAQRVLDQADKVTCTSQSLGLPVSDKYSTLPPIRRKKHRVVKPSLSLREKNPRVVRELVKEGNSSSSTERGSVVKPSLSLREKNPRVVKEGNSSSSTERGSVVKRPRTSLVRSASDVGTSEDNKTKFWSLDRLKSRKSKAKVEPDDVGKVQRASILSKSDRRFNSDSDVEPDDVGKVQRASILNKPDRRFNSDSEVGPDDVGKVQRASILSKSDRRFNSDSEVGPDDVDKVQRASILSKSDRRFNSDSDVGPDDVDKVQRASILSKSRRFNSDSEASPKKQLSPIIEASPQEDYFEPQAPQRARKKIQTMETMLHSSQTISKPVLTRGRTVDTMVRKLSQDRAGRGPPRVVSPLKALAGSPGDDRQHNNNLPFSYTEPPLYGHDESALFAQDKYVPTSVSPTSHSLQGGEPTQVIYAEVICQNGGGKATVHTSVPLSKVETPMSGYTTNLVEGRGRADGMDSRRNQQEDESYRRVSPIRRNLMEDFINNEAHRGYNYKPRLVCNLDLSSRRDRLESRIESQRKDRLLSSRSHQDIHDSRIIENHRKYPSNPRLDSENHRKYPSNPRLDSENHRKYPSNPRLDSENHRKYPSNPRLDSEYIRREFLNSQLNHDSVTEGDRYYGDKLTEGDRYYGDKKDQLTEVDRYYGDKKDQLTEVDRYYGDKKDQLTDSGIDINYHGGLDVSGVTGAGKVVSELRTYHNTYETTTNTDVNVRVPKHRNKKPTVTNVTKVDVNGHIKPEGSDEEEDSPKYYYNQQENIDQMKKRSGLQSTRLVQETKRSADVVPPSAVLIRHYGPVDDERSTLKRKCDLGDIEETRRFLVEERRRSVEDGGDEGRRPEKVVEVEKRVKKPGTMDKMRALFSRGEAKKKRGADPLTARYVEYRGEPHKRVETRRERLATPSPSPSRPATLNRVNHRNVEADNNSGSWFKSLDRLRGRSKPKPKIEHQAVISENEAEEVNKTNNNNVDKSNKNLRFFGDTDSESVRSQSHSNHHRVVKPMSSLPENPSTARYGEGGSQQSSTRYVPLRDGGNNRRYKSGNNKLQVPRRRHHRSAGELATSSAESTTEGDSSQQSQRSVVYLHAATVGDIPGRVPSRTARRAHSREELSSTGGSTIQPQTRTVSRSISVLAPWKPRHYREGLEVHYENGGGGRPPKIPPGSASTLNRLKNNKNNSLSHNDKENHSRKSMNSLVDSNNKSIESLGKGGKVRGSTVELTKTGGATLKKGKTESAKKRTELSRSVSMPKDSKVKSGWFRRKTRS